MVNVVGDHARSHKRLDAPLESDIDAVAGTVSSWVRRSLSPATVAADAAEAVAAARTAPGGIATLILPADVSWEDGAAAGRPGRRPPRPAGGARRGRRRGRGAGARGSRRCCSSAATRWGRPGSAPRRGSPPAPARG